MHAAVSSPPLVVGRYQLDRTLGRGANAAVYGAHSLDDGATVALKIFHEGVDASSPARASLEATIGQGVHPNVVRTIEVGRWKGRPWLAMELLDGPTLSDWLHELSRPVLLREALRIAQDVAAGLESLHRAGVVHRDLGPTNIVLTKGRAHLIDLGSARRVGAMDTVRTLRASPGCLAPERLLEGRTCSAAEDMWALGVLLYRMTAGHHPFEASSIGAMMNRVLRCHPSSVRESRSNVPTALSLFILKLLAKSPEARPTITDAMRVLARWTV